MPAPNRISSNRRRTRRSKTNIRSKGSIRLLKRSSIRRRGNIHPLSIRRRRFSIRRKGNIRARRVNIPPKAIRHKAILNRATRKVLSRRTMPHRRLLLLS